MQASFATSQAIAILAFALLLGCGARTGLSTPFSALEEEDGGMDAAGPDARVDTGVEVGPFDDVVDAGVDARDGGPDVDAGNKVTTVLMIAVPGTADLYRSTNPAQGDTPPVMASNPPVCPGTQVRVTAMGCVVSQGPICVGPDGNNGGDFNGLPVYSLIGRWGTSPNGLTPATVASPPFFVGSNGVLTSPPGPGRYFLYLAENDGIFSDNSLAYLVTVSYTQSPTCN
jgi:hypothetical protein